MAYRVIFEDVKNTIHEVAILDSVPNVGDDIMITYRDQDGRLTGDEDAFSVKHRTFGFEKFDRPVGLSPLDNAMRLVTVHVLLGDSVHPIVFEKPED